MPPEALRSIQAKVSTPEPKAPGDKIFSSGQQAEEVFFVSSGEVHIRGRDGATIATVSAGNFFGEIGVLFDIPRTADAIVSQGPCQLHWLSRSCLNEVTEAHGLRSELQSRGQALPSVRSWFVAQLPLFKKCCSELGFLKAVAGALKVRTACAGEVVVHEGEEGHEMFFIFAGKVTVMSRRRGVQLSAPNFFGELALLYAEPRSATVKCTSSCRFYVLNRESLHRIMQEFPRVIGMMYSAAQEASNVKVHFIHKIPLFKAMVHDEEFVANVQLALQSFSAAPGECLVQQGAMSDGRMFIVAHGHAQVRQVKQVGEAPETVATLGAGAMFGEISLLLDTPRVASVVACGHCHIYTLSRDAFETLAVVYESWWKELISQRGVLLKQLRDTGIGIGASTTTKTHHLQMPELGGTSASSMLSAAEVASAPEGVSEGRLCLVCRSQEKCFLSTPCGHITACEGCQASLRACPLCRKQIENSIRAYF